MGEPCPGRDCLGKMLQEDLPAALAVSIERHVADCLDCQRILADLTHDARFAEGRIDEVPSAGASEFLRRMIERRPEAVPFPDGASLATVPSVPAAGPASWPAIEGHEILGELGRGGMGVVFLAREARLNRVVALKMLLPGEHESAELVARFRGEAETIARLQHPNIVQIHSVGDHQGRPFFVMEHVGGGSLAARLDGAPWPSREAAALVEAIARGIEAVHGLGVIHRDLKPSNVLMTGDGSPKVSDFGLAKDLAGDLGLTRTDVVLGSPSYMAPEQAEGGPRGAVPASDVYSLGAVYYELLTGRPPFRGTSVLDTLHQVRTLEPVPPSRLAPGLSRDAETIALKCLEKAPARRYRSAGELAEDLRRFMERRPIAARRIGPAGRLVRWALRSPGMAGLAATVLLLLVVVTGVSVIAAVRVAAAAEREWRTLYFARMNLTQQAWEASDVQRMRELLELHRTDTDRGFEWFYWWRRAHQSAVELIGHRRPIVALAFSPDGRALVSAGDEPSLIVWGPSRREARDRIPLTERATSLAVGRDGTTIAVGGEDGAVRIWKAGDRGPSATLRRPRGGAVMALAFVDERTLVSAQVPNITRTWEWPSGKLLRERQGADLPPAGYDNHLPAHAMSADGRLVAAAALDGTVFVRPTEAGGPVRGPSRGVRFDDERSFPAGTTPGMPARSLAFSRDGRLLAIGGEDHSITIRDLDWRATVSILREHTASVWSLAFSPDGRLLAAASLDNTVSIWNVASGQLAMVLKGHGGAATAVAFAPDGQSVASGGADCAVQLWRARGGDPDAPLEGHADGLRTVAVSPDGSTVATGGRDGRILFWSAATGEPAGGIELGPVPGPARRSHVDVIEALAYSNDGRWLVSGGWSGARLWDARGHALVAELRGDEGGRPDIYALAVSPNGALLASGRGDGMVTLWDLERRLPLATYRGDDGPIVALSFAPDGRTLASASQPGRIRIWNVARARAERDLVLDGSTFLTVAFAPDGRTLASGTGEGALVYWDTTSWRPRRPQRAHSNEVTSIAFFPDGRTLVSGGRDNMVRLWDVATGELKSTFKGHSGNVMELAVARDGRAVVSASLDRTARIWRAASEDDIRRHRDNKPAAP